MLPDKTKHIVFEAPESILDLTTTEEHRNQTGERQTFAVHNSFGPDYVFEGQLAAAVRGFYSTGDEQPDVTTKVDLLLYRDAYLQYICVRKNHWFDGYGYNTSRVEYVAEKHEVHAFFGYGILAKSLYEDADIPCQKRLY